MTLAAKSDRRIALESPHASAHADSVARQRGARPKGLAALLTWFVAEFNAETPTRIHRRGVFFGRPDRLETRTLWARESTPDELAGGSLIGSPADDGAFRGFIENGPMERNEDGDYVRPMRAALGIMAGRSRHSEQWYHAHVLWAIGGAAGDWRGVTLRMGIPPQAAAIYVESLLNRLWSISQREANHSVD